MRPGRWREREGGESGCGVAVGVGRGKEGGGLGYGPAATAGLRVIPAARRRVVRPHTAVLYSLACIGTSASAISLVRIAAPLWPTGTNEEVDLVSFSSVTTWLLAVRARPRSQAALLSRHCSFPHRRQGAPSEPGIDGDLPHSGCERPLTTVARVRVEGEEGEGEGRVARASAGTGLEGAACHNVRGTTASWCYTQRANILQLETATCTILFQAEQGIVDNLGVYRCYFSFLRK